MHTKSFYGLEGISRIIGFVISYSLFTAILYFVWSYVKGLPHGMSLLHVAAITALITVAGFALKRALR